MITQKELTEHLSYDKDTGAFTRKYSKRPQFIGLKVGTVAKNGYIVISIKNKTYYAHRLAWLYVYGYLPKRLIDHVNRVRIDNRIENLREATYCENSQNVLLPKKTSSTQAKGVEIHPNGRYRAYITLNKKKIHLGYHNTLEEAIEARKAGELLYHPFYAAVVTSRKQPF